MDSFDNDAALIVSRLRNSDSCGNSGTHVGFPYAPFLLSHFHPIFSVLKCDHFQTLIEQDV